MNYVVAIDNFNVNNSFLVNLSNYINERLNDLNINSYIINNSNSNITNDEKIQIVKQRSGTGNNVILLSNRLNGSNVEIMYALRNNDLLAENIYDAFVLNNIEVEKYYQKRDENDTSLDDDYLIRNSKNNQTIVINYGDDTNIEKLGESVVKGIADYTNTYYPINTGDFYVVQKGDTLYSISKKLNTTVDKIKNLNNLSNNTITIGQILKIPSQDSSTNNVTYTVIKGDSLWKIANNYNTTVDKIKEANNLSSNLLSIGQKLIIPSSENYITYTVKKGDSLWKIANNYNTTVDKIKKLNNLSSNLLSINQKLLIPN